MVLREFILPVTKLSQTELTCSILDSRVFEENKKQKDIGKTRNNFVLI